MKKLHLLGLAACVACHFPFVACADDAVERLDENTLILTVPDGASWTSSGAFAENVTNVVKCGGGTAVFTQSSPAARLVVSNGLVRLAAETGPAFFEVRVERDARVILDRDEQIADTGELYLLGTFDFNGHGETLACFGNNTWHADGDTSAASFFDDQSARLVNTGDADATLTLNGRDSARYSDGSEYYYAYRGSCEETAGRIILNLAGGQFCFRAMPETFKPSEINFTTAYARLLDYVTPDVWTFVFKGEPGFELAEIMMTSGGKPVSASIGCSVTGGKIVGTSTSPPVNNRLKDTNGETCVCATNGEMTVKITLTPPTPVDGYVLVAGDKAKMPAEWKVYARRNTYVGSGNVLADARQGETARQSNMPVGPYAFNSSVLPVSGLSAQTRITTVKTSWPSSVSSTQTTFGTLEGPMPVHLKEGARLSVGDISKWTGTLRSEGSVGGTLLMSASFGAEQPLPLTSTALSALLSIANGGNVPLTLTLPDDRTLNVCLADGAGKTTLAKKGEGTATVGSFKSGWTGPTQVSAGTLKVQGTLPTGAVTARYVRFRTIRVNGGASYADPYGYNIALGEFELRDADNAKIAWPAGLKVTSAKGFHASCTAAMLTDGKPTTRCLAKSAGDKTTDLYPIVFDLGTRVTFAGYAWWASSNVNSDSQRMPAHWAIDVSDDGANWSTVHEGSATYDASDFAKGPFALGGMEALDSDFACAVPEGFRGAVGPRDTRLKSIRAQYIRFLVLKTLNPNKSDYSWGWHLSEFSLYRNGERIPWEGAGCAAVGGTVHEAAGSSVARFIDNIRTGSKDPGSDAQNRVFLHEVPTMIDINARKVVEFDAYGFTSVAAYADRTPVSWQVFVSSNKTDWVLVDTKSDEPSIAMRTEYTDYGPWSIAENFPLGRDGALDALGDGSELQVDAGATVLFETAYEKAGALSGAGDLRLSPLGVTFEIGTTASNAVFSGKTYGTASTLVLSGEGEQGFDGADLSAFSTVEFNGGVLRGNASFGGGSVALAFGGGALGGTLTNIGALTITGEVRYALPNERTAEGIGRLKICENCTLSDEAKAALAAGRAVNVPKSRLQRVEFDGTSATLVVERPGLLFIVR